MELIRHKTVFRAQINLPISGTLCCLVPALQTMHTLDPGIVTSWVLCHQDRFSDPGGEMSGIIINISISCWSTSNYRAQIKRDRGESQNFRGWNVRVRVRHLSQTETQNQANIQNLGCCILGNSGYEGQMIVWAETVRLCNPRPPPSSRESDIISGNPLVTLSH